MIEPASNLTPQQLRIIAAIATGTPATKAAAAENIHRNTIGNWRRTNPAFAHELESAQHEYRQHCQDQITSLLPQAIQAIEACLTSDSLSVRLRAATLILKLTAPRPEKLASFIPGAESAVETANPAQECTTTPSDKPAQALASFIPTPQIVHKSAKPAQECTKPQTARNAPCPCRSGLKFKRCCANKPLGMAA